MDSWASSYHYPAIEVDSAIGWSVPSRAVGEDLVSLYRCKACGVRMFEAHIDVHLRTHHSNLSTRQPLSHFIRGPRDTHSRPGGQAITYGRVRTGKGGRRKGAVVSTPLDDNAETVDEDPVVVLDELGER